MKRRGFLTALCALPAAPVVAMAPAPPVGVASGVITQATARYAIRIRNTPGASTASARQIAATLRAAARPFRYRPFTTYWRGGRINPPVLDGWPGATVYIGDDEGETFTPAWVG